MSAAVPGSGMNSLKVTRHRRDKPHRRYRKKQNNSYFSTQDNMTWASPDEGPNLADCRYDGGDSYGLQVTHEARPGTPVTVAFVAIGGGDRMRFTDGLLANSRTIPNLDQNGQPLEGMRQAFLLRRRTIRH
jgi:hypothetical protein